MNKTPVYSLSGKIRALPGWHLKICLKCTGTKHAAKLLGEILGLLNKAVKEEANGRSRQQWAKADKPTKAKKAKRRKGTPRSSRAR